MERPAVADYPRGARMAPRVIDDFEFVWMLAGQARMATQDAEWVLAPGLLLLVPPGVRHAFTWDQRRACRHGYVHFRPERIGMHAPVGVEVRRMTRHDPLAGLCAYLVWLGHTQPDGWQQPTRRTLRTILELFVSGPLPDDDVSPPVTDTLLRVVASLQEEWAQLPLRRIGAGELAAAVAVSPSYLNRLFQSQFQISVARGLESLRFARAETLLTRTDMPIGAIAHQCGFADPFHFTHRFTRRYGHPPREYRSQTGPAVSVLDHSGVRRLAYALWG